MKKAAFINHKVTDEGVYIRGISEPGMGPDIEIFVPRDEAEMFGWIDPLEDETENPLSTADNEVKNLRSALSEIGVAASEALTGEHVTDWAEGGRLGDALIGIKDIVQTALQKEAYEKGQLKQGFLAFFAELEQRNPNAI